VQYGLELFGAAFVASVFGSMVGLGGGFILVPILRLFFGLGPAEAAGTSLVLVVANSASGAFTHLLQKRVHVNIGLLIALGGFPGSIIGTILVRHISPRLFDWIFAVMLIVVATDMIVNAKKRAGSRVETHDVRHLKGMSYRLAIVTGFAVGLVGGLFGIGGGMIIVPTLLYFSELSAHAISATSQFAIVLTSPVGLTMHALQHDIRVDEILPLVLGGLCGGPLGARLSLRLKSAQLLVFVAGALVLAALLLVARPALR
jgi:uncharacterized membrane protein YfcA